MYKVYTILYCVHITCTYKVFWGRYEVSNAIHALTRYSSEQRWIEAYITALSKLSDRQGLSLAAFLISGWVSFLSVLLSAVLRWIDEFEIGSTMLLTGEQNMFVNKVNKHRLFEGMYERTVYLHARFTLHVSFYVGLHYLDSYVYNNNLINRVRLQIYP